MADAVTAVNSCFFINPPKDYHVIKVVYELALGRIILVNVPSLFIS
jgi:hypothetical protein